MKLDRTLFPPLTKEDFLCEYYLTPATAAEFWELMKLPPDKRPGRLKIRGPLPKRVNAKQK